MTSPFTRIASLLPPRGCMNPALRSPGSSRCARLLVPAALLLGLYGTLSVEPLGAGPAQDAAVQLLFSDRPDDPEPKANWALRPNQFQPLYLYMRHSGKEPKKVTLEVLVGGQSFKESMDAEGGGKLSLVRFGKPGAAPPAKPPELVEGKGKVQVRLQEGENKPRTPVEVPVWHPRDYVFVEREQGEPATGFYPAGESANKKNRLVVRVKARDNFAGPPCRVDLDLRPESIPGLVASQELEGRYGGSLTGKDDELILVAEDIQFVEGKQGPEGVVYLTVDGYERAFAFTTTFPRSGAPTKLEALTHPVVRLIAPAYARPDAKYRLGVQLDKAEGRETHLAAYDLSPEELERLRKNETAKNVEKKLKASQEGDAVQFTGERREQLFFAPPGPDGKLLFRPQFHDWSTELDMAGVHGERLLRLRLFDKGKSEPVEFRLPTSRTLVDQLVQTVRFDGSKPASVAFGEFPKQMVRGAPLTVTAVGRDDQSGIKQVVFFAGPPGPDGGPAKDAIAARGELRDKDTNLWAADLSVDTDKKGKVVVSVQFTNGAGLSDTKTVTIQLIDPPAGGQGAAAGLKPGRIEGSVLEGSRLQSGVTVALVDAQGAVKGTTTSDAKGLFRFEDVVPGSYRVLARKGTTNTKAEAAVQVREGEKKTGVELKLFR